MSGEALQSSDVSCGIQSEKLAQISAEIARVTQLGVQVALVIGAGNFVRGAGFCETEVDRITADQMGMLATIMNALVHYVMRWIEKSVAVKVRCLRLLYRVLCLAIIVVMHLKHYSKAMLLFLQAAQVIL